MPSTDLCVFRSGRLFEADMVCGALEEQGIPFYRRVESGGIEQAMPAPAAPGPGVAFTVWVPRQAETEAREVLESLPLDPERQPDAIDFTSSRRVHAGLRVFAWILLVFVAMSFLGQCAGSFRELFGG